METTVRADPVLVADLRSVFVKLEAAEIRPEDFTREELEDLIARRESLMQNIISDAFPRLDMAARASVSVTTGTVTVGDD